MTDRELLEFAAKANGIDLSDKYTSISPCCREVWFASESSHGSKWSPFNSDGDALRLAVKLKIIIDYQDGCSWACNSPRQCLCEFYNEHNGNSMKATRRAIVRAAAEIGRAMP